MIFPEMATFQEVFIHISDEFPKVSMKENVIKVLKYNQLLSEEQ